MLEGLLSIGIQHNKDLYKKTGRNFRLKLAFSGLKKVKKEWKNVRIFEL